MILQIVFKNACKVINLCGYPRFSVKKVGFITFRVNNPIGLSTRNACRLYFAQSGFMHLQNITESKGVFQSDMPESHKTAADAAIPAGVRENST
jgi:hypothetical protein